MSMAKIDGNCETSLSYVGVPLGLTLLLVNLFDFLIQRRPNEIWHNSVKLVDFNGSEYVQTKPYKSHPLQSKPSLQEEEGSGHEKTHSILYSLWGLFFGGEKPYEGSLQPIETADELTKNDKTYVCWDK